MLIDGKTIAAEIIERLKNQSKPKKFFAAFLIGENPASESFVRQKRKAAEALGVDFRTYHLDEKLSSDELRAEIHKVVDGSACGAALVQLPFPGNINGQYVLNAIPAEKDPDVLGERALGAFYAGRNKVLPPAVATVEEILKKFPLDLAASTIAVVGAGKLIGKPVSVWLSGQVKELFVFKEGSDLEDIKKAEIVILGAGVAGLIKPEMLKDGAGVIDFGYSKNSEGKISGDFDYSSLLQPTTNNLQPAFFTPTPGGTGPILVAKLFENFYKLNQK